jgi:hypothetical protein
MQSVSLSLGATADELGFAQPEGSRIQAYGQNLDSFALKLISKGTASLFRFQGKLFSI